MINREISWLSFNERVLQEAADKRNPLIERLRFLGIYSNNLDEFYRVRVATMRRLRDYKKEHPGDLDFSPFEILKQIGVITARQQKRFDQIYGEILEHLEKENIILIDEKDLTADQAAYVTRYFREQVRSSLFPVMLKTLKRSSFLQDHSIYLAVHMGYERADKKDDGALIRLPVGQLPRFVMLPKSRGISHVILLDDVVRYNLASIFSIFDYDNFNAYTVKLTRDAELDIENDLSRSFMERMAESLKQRASGRPVRFIYDKDMPDVFLRKLIRRLRISQKDNIIPGARYQNFKDYMQFPNVGRPDLEFPPAQQLPHRHLAGTRSIQKAIRNQDILLHFPYQSFQYIIDMLREASIDPKVKEVKMTLYRVARESNVVNALINAARNGKKVTVFLELQARFDEHANIYWSQKMMDEGIEVIHGMPGIKVHCKLLLIKRKHKGEIERFANIGTGNFNEDTAKRYTDESLLTAHPGITREVERVFAMFESSYQAHVDFDHLVVSPFATRQVMLELLDNEMRHARAGLKAAIFWKLNSLVDEEVVEKLYEASKAGVICRLIVRGICVLRPEIKGLSENIEVISILDRYLEHGRIYYFSNNGSPKIYLGSADMMVRNLDNRIEVSCPVYDPGLQAELKAILDTHWKDNVKARIVDADQGNMYRQAVDSVYIRSQEAIYNYLRECYYQP